jgi:uncharacterized protein
MMSVWRAAFEGNIDHIRHLSRAGADIRAYDDEGHTPLWHAVVAEKGDAINLLLELGATSRLWRGEASSEDMEESVPSRGAVAAEDFRDPHFIAQAGLIDQMRDLLDNGTRVDHRNGRQDTPLMSSVDANRVGIVRLLLQRGADANASDRVGNKPIIRAAIRGNYDLIPVLVAGGATVGLVEAALLGHASRIFTALTSGTAPDTSAPSGLTLLMAACVWGELSLITGLLKSGAGLEQSDCNGRTALMWAVSRGQFEATSVLLHFNANPNIADRFGTTPLMLAARGKDVRLVDILLTAGSDLEARDRAFRKTPLHWACELGSVEVVRALLSAGSNAEATDRFGSTGTAMAANRGDVEVLRTIIAAVPVSGVLLRDVQASLPSAASQGDFGVLSTLLETLRTIDQVDYVPTSALLRAVLGGNVDVIRLFLEHAGRVNKGVEIAMRDLARSTDRPDILRLIDQLTTRTDDESTTDPFP